MLLVTPRLQGDDIEDVHQNRKFSWIELPRFSNHGNYEYTFGGYNDFVLGYIHFIKVFDHLCFIYLLWYTLDFFSSYLLIYIKVFKWVFMSLIFKTFNA